MGDSKTPGYEVVSLPTVIEHNNLRFVIMDAPTDENVHAYVDMLKNKGVVHVVQACESSYNTQPMKDAGIRVTNLQFPDGDPPPPEIVSKWLELVGTELGSNAKGESEAKKAIGVHCVAGLGRAPVLVCIALVEAGMDPYDAIGYIRKRRRGAINARQLQFIETYKPIKTAGCCAVQ